MSGPAGRWHLIIEELESRIQDTARAGEPVGRRAYVHSIEDLYRQLERTGSRLRVSLRARCWRSSSVHRS